MIPKKKERIKPRYTEAKDREESPEERLSGALRSQGRKPQDLLYMLESMRSPTAVERRTEMFDPSARFSPRGRAFDQNGSVRYQAPSETEGEYRTQGVIPSKGDVSEITGGRGETSSRGQIQVAKMLRDPAVMRYFMDLYEKAGEQRAGGAATLSSNKKSLLGSILECLPDKEGKVPASCKGPKAAYN